MPEPVVELLVDDTGHFQPEVAGAKRRVPPLGLVPCLQGPGEIDIEVERIVFLFQVEQAPGQALMGIVGFPDAGIAALGMGGEGEKKGHKAHDHLTHPAVCL